MAQHKVLQSVVTRLVACMVIGGVVLSAGMALLDRARVQGSVRLNLTRDFTQTARNLQNLFRGPLARAVPDELQQALAGLTSDPRIRAARLVVPGGPGAQVGQVPAAAEARDLWVLPELAIPTGTEVGLDRFTLLRAPFTRAGAPCTLELLIDGPRALHAAEAQSFELLKVEFLFMALMTLLGLLLLRRWFGTPLAQTMDLIRTSAGAERFDELAREHHGEFRQLGQTLSGMLARLDATTLQLRQRERAFEDLYQFAPAAMVSLDPAGGIVAANRRAAELLARPDVADLIGRPLLNFIRPEDRGRLRQTIDRLDLDPAARCEIRLRAGDGPEGPRTLDALAECAGVRDDNGRLQQVRISLLDVSASKQLQRQLAENTRLLNLVFDHMSDGLLLIDHHGRVAAENQTLAKLLHHAPGQALGHGFDPEHFWDQLGVLHQDLFVARLRQIDADTGAGRSAQERFETRSGVFQFQGVPVHDAAAQVAGRLWIVQETTAQQQAQLLLEQQTQRLQALRQLGQQLGDIAGTDDLLCRAAGYAYDTFGAEAVGLALRHDQNSRRSRQLLHRGSGGYLLQVNRALLDAVEQHLMPRTLAGQDVVFWPDLPASQPWTGPFLRAGLTCVAGAPLRGNGDMQGIIWVARRNGERLERQHIHLLEALAPLLASRLEFAQLRDRFRQLELTDPTTDLPNPRQFDQVLTRLQNRPGYPWALVVLKIDHFGDLNQALDHLAADRLLRQVAGALQGAVRKSCEVARLDGPVFAVACTDASMPQAVAIAERLRQSVGALSVTGPHGQTLTLTASLGVAACPDDGPHASDLLAAATARVEIAKRTGRNRVVARGLPGDRQVG